MFAKVFGQIYDSSIAEDYLLRLVFEDFLTLADINGVVDMTPESISRRTNVPLDIVKKYITILESPDLKSRRKNDSGRRIVKLDEHRDWGWLIVNYEFYRNLASEDQRREKTRQRVVKYREKLECNALKRNVTKCNALPSSSPSLNSSLKSSLSEVEIPESINTHEFLTAWENWKQHRKEIKKPLTRKSAEMQMKEFLTWGPTGAVEAIEYTIKKGWQGIRQPDNVDKTTINQRRKPPDLKKSFTKSRDEIIAKLEEANKAGGDSVSRELSACNDTYRDVPKQNGEQVVDEAYKIFKFRENK